MTRLQLVAAVAIVAAVTAPSVLAAGVTTDSATVQPPSATLNWTARNDSRIYGYLIYRAATSEGPFRRISDAIVHVASDEAEAVHEYRFVDHEVIPGRTYYYYLDTIGLDGRKHRFSGVVAKTVGEP